MSRKCSACGETNEGVLHEHHIHGRKVSDETVTLCPNCHALNHAKLLLTDNEASRNAIAEIDKIGKPISAKQFREILDKYGYKPYFDGEEEWLRANGYIE